MQLLDPQTGLVVWDASWGVPAPQGGRYIEFDGPTAEMRQPAPRVNALEQMFNGTGIPERVNALNQTFNPVNAMGEAGRQAGIMLDPETSPMGRVGALGGMLTGMSGAVLPMAVAARYGGSAANAVTEAMTGFAPKGNAFLADEFGGMRLYHGSPHDFDKFSMDKIGTGEGAQAYGHGLYFAESEDVAKSYKDLQPASGIAATDGAGWEARAAFDIAKGNTKKAVDVLNKRRQTTLDAAGFLEDGGKKSLAYIDEAIRRIESGDLKRGRMYEVEVNANPDDFLDSDLPLKKQPQRIRDALAPVVESLKGVRMNEYARKEILSGKAKGADLYSVLDLTSPGGSQFERAAAATAKLREAGISGIKYLDAGSRTGGTSSRNVVVFDENLINIVRKYGVAGAAAVLGISAADVEAAMAGQRE